MTPFGKPAAQVQLANLQLLIDDQVPEGRYIEYKADIPVSDEERKRQRRAGETQPVDRSWLKAGPIMDYGRDKLMEELVAFANADGGVLILGMKQTEGAPARAETFNPLPDVAALERRLRDVIVNCIEPRLPYAAVKAIPTNEDGAGLVLLEVEPSRLGPHRVRKTREATIRREDCCASMSMLEIHDMVLRNARRLDAVTATLKNRSEQFQGRFVSALIAHVPGTYVGAAQEARLASWFQGDRIAALGIRVTLVPHDDLGIPRLEHLAGLVPNSECVRQATSGRNQPVPGADVVWLAGGGGRRVLGGVEQTDDSGGRVRTYRVLRDGFVEAAVISWGVRDEVDVHVGWVVAMVACVLGVYEKLRDQAGAPSMPADIGVEVLTRGGGVRTRIGGGSFTLGSVPLDPVTAFPRYTVSDRESFSETINAVAGDLANAGDMSARDVPSFELA
jgi:Putative DNA-binding domain